MFKVPLQITVGLIFGGFFSLKIFLYAEERREGNFHLVPSLPQLTEIHRGFQYLLCAPLSFPLQQSVKSLHMTSLLGMSL